MTTHSLTPRGLMLVLIAVALPAPQAVAEPWTAARIRALPDSAFAVVETTANGGTARHLPHHDETGALDEAHLRAALGRLGQVRWRDPANREVARRHLEGHRRAQADR